jgi:uncharacterized protein YeaO (DUF488 family)
MDRSVRLSTVQFGSPRKRGEGLRIGTVRFLPRGVRKADYARLDYFDVRLPQLAQSRKLLAEFKDGDVSMPTFFRPYRAEMKCTEPRQLIELLAAIARRTPITVGCYCDHESRCHRSVLGELIRKAGGD